VTDPRPERHGAWRRPIAVVGVLLLLYAIFAVWVVPALIRSAYAGESFAFLNRIIRGQASHPVDFYLDQWRSRAGYLAVLPLLLGIAILGWRSAAGATRRWAGSRPALRDGDTLFAVALLGVLSSLAEVCSRLIGYWVLHRPSGDFTTNEVFWMAPLAAVTTLLLVALPVLAVRRVFRMGAWVNHALLFVLVALCVFGFGRVARAGIHPAAQLILALGVARLATRPFETNPAFANATRRAAIAACAGVLLWAAFQPIRSARYASIAPWDSDRPAPAGSPNVLVLVWDTVRAASLSLYGHNRETSPNLDSLAARSAVFDNAISTAPWTLPSHASLLTGQSPQGHGADRESPLARSVPTLAEVLGARGYQTAGFAANTFWLGRAFGLERGFHWYEDRPHLGLGAILTTWSGSDWLYDQWSRTQPQSDSPLRLSARDMREAFERWLEGREEAPFFAFINLFDAHEPYLPPDGFGFRFATGIPLATYSAWTARPYPPDSLQQLRDAYDSSIYYLDHQFGQLLQMMEQRGLLENTIIVVTSDHGETLGEHRADLLGHDNNMYDDVLRIPLVIHVPSGLGAGKRFAAPASLADVPATIMALVDSGMARPFPGVPLLTAEADSMPGRVLAAYATPADWHENIDAFPISRGPMHSLHRGQWHYVVDGHQQESLFDLAHDPWELTDLADSVNAAGQLAAFRALRITDSASAVRRP
jgi:arylsulfatase A-like enzyme